MRVLSVLALLCTVSGCGWVFAPDDATEIRLANTGSVAFDSVVVTFPTQREVFGALAAGARSEYREVGEAYRYAAIRAYSGTTVRVLQPIDYVGERVLGSGRHTYELWAEGDQPTLGFNFRRD